MLQDLLKIGTLVTSAYRFLADFGPSALKSFDDKFEANATVLPGWFGFSIASSVKVGVDGEILVWLAELRSAKDKGFQEFGKFHHNLAHYLFCCLKKCLKQV